MEEQSWLVEERTELNARTLMGLERSLSVTRAGPAHAGAAGELAVRLTSLVILDNRKWFGEADVRLDALVACVPATRRGELYHPQTFRFARVGDGDALVSEPGLLLFYGRPRYFLDVSISVSRDRRDSETLASLITRSAGSAAVGESLQVLAGVATIDPTAQIVVGAVTAAGRLATRPTACCAPRRIRRSGSTGHPGFSTATISASGRTRTIVARSGSRT